jgi:hypothetical protein
VFRTLVVLVTCFATAIATPLTTIVAPPIAAMDPIPTPIAVKKGLISLILRFRLTVMT